MYSQAYASASVRGLPSASVIVVTEKVSAGRGWNLPEKRQAERWSPVGAPEKNRAHVPARSPKITSETSMTHCNLAHKFSPMPQAMKIPDAKAAVDK